MKMRRYFYLSLKFPVSIKKWRKCMNYYLDAWRNFAVFSGRATRTDFWMFVLFNILALIVLLVLGSLIKPLIFLYGLYCLAVIIPNLAITVRRLHDTSRSGWWWFIGFVPVVGGIILLVFMCLPSTPGPNQYGE